MVHDGGTLQRRGIQDGDETIQTSSRGFADFESHVSSGRDRASDQVLQAMQDRLPYRAGHPDAEGAGNFHLATVD